MTAQMLAAPYREPVDNYVAMACSVATLIAFACSAVYKYDALTATDDLRAVMSDEQRHDYAAHPLLLSGIHLLALLGTLAAGAAIAVHQARVNRRAELHSRRLRFVETREAVAMPRLPAGALQFHLFLSHAWISGQDQMRVVKQRLREMLPGIRIFLDVDDMQGQEACGADFIRASQVMVLDGFCVLFDRS